MGGGVRMNDIEKKMEALKAEFLEKLEATEISIIISMTISELIIIFVMIIYRTDIKLKSATAFARKSVPNRSQKNAVAVTV